MIFTIELELDRVNINQQVKYLDQRSFCVKVTVWTHTYTEDQSLYQFTKILCNNTRCKHTYSQALTLSQC